MTTTTTQPDDTGDRPDRRPTWIRGAFMLFFIIAFSIAQTLLSVIAVIQFLSLLITREPNAFLTGFGRSLAVWLQQTAAFQAAATEEKPFPWAPWPAAE